MTLLLLFGCQAPGTDQKPVDDSAAADSADTNPGDTSDTAHDTAGSGCGEDIPLEPGLARTTHGVYQGEGSGESWAWLGIPFARPPVGDLRFAPPEPPDCHEELAAAASWPPLCPQRDDAGAIEGEEDCLYLNVWAPADGKGPAPVLFFVHGGGNVGGGASTVEGDLHLYDGATLAARTGSVVIVTNYRVGALGFLAHPALTAEAGVSGNYGLRDQVLALEWARDNAAAFGGDPDRVLLFGESAGAMDACALLVSPLTEGLFDAVMMESGGCSQPELAEREEEGEEKVAQTGCDVEPDVAACLRGLDAEVLAALSEDQISGFGVPGQGGFGPAVDGVVLPMDPEEGLETGAAHDVPLGIGTNADEASQWVPDLSEEEFATWADTLLGRFAEDVLPHYPLENYPSPRWAWIDLLSDATFTCPARRIARAKAAGGSAPVYRYWFTKDPEGLSGRTYGATHGLELVYVFQQLDGVEAETGYEASAADRAVEAAMGGAWAALAEGAGPDGAHLPVSWPVYEAEPDPFLELGEGIQAGERLHEAACDEWDRLFAFG